MTPRSAVGPSGCPGGAAPIRDIDGEIRAAVALSGPMLRLTGEVIPGVAEQVLAAAATISQRNGEPKRG